MSADKVNEFELHEQLVILKNISERYPGGRSFCPVIEKALVQITS